MIVDMPHSRLYTLALSLSVAALIPVAALAVAEEAAAAGSSFDRLKGIALNEAGDVKLSIGGQLRVRWEHWDDFAFGSENDDDFGLLRLKLHLDTRVGEDVRVFIEGRSSQATDRSLPGGRRTLDEDTLALQNAYVDVNLSLPNEQDVAVRAGRQELKYGKQRLVSPLDWSNTTRRWDGVRVQAHRWDWTVDAFFTQFVPVDKTDFNEPDSDNVFFGLYATHDLVDRDLLYDVYWLGSDRAEDDERFTTGVRVEGKVAEHALDYEVEGAFQYGDEGGEDVEAFFVAAVVGHRPTQLPANARLYLGYGYASGDDDPGDGDNNTFDHLFPLGHAYLGYIDIVGRANVQDFSQGVACWPVADVLMVKVEHHVFRRAETSDGLYNAGGGVVRAGDASTSRDIGNEIDLTAKCVINARAAVTAGYSRFFAGDFVEESGDGEDTDFAYGSLQFTF